MAVRIRAAVAWSGGYLAPMTSGELYASTDGELWRLVHGGPSGPAVQIVESSHGLIAIAGDPDGPCELGGTCQLPAGHAVIVWGSQDGQHWTRLGPAKGLGTVEVLGLATFRTGPLVAVVCARYVESADPPQQDCVPASSQDGVTWTRGTPPSPTWVPYRVVAGLGSYEIVGGAGIPRVVAAWWSGDGRTWQAATLETRVPVVHGAISRLLVGRDGLIATGGRSEADTSDWYRTKTGKDWQVDADDAPVGQTPPQDSLPCPGGVVESGAGRFVAARPNGNGWTSFDGNGWTSFDGSTWGDFGTWTPRSRYGCGGTRTFVVLPRGVATWRWYGAGR
jgi:hypothetical protein